MEASAKARIESLKREIKQHELRILRLKEMIKRQRGEEWGLLHRVERTPKKTILQDKDQESSPSSS